MNLYRNESSNPKWNAQRNLCGRTHYVDDDTLKWHKSRVLIARDCCQGLLFYIITSDALDMDNTRRGFRYVIFDVFGNTVARPDLEHAFRTSDQASKAMWIVLNELDPYQLTRDALARNAAEYQRDLMEMNSTVNALEQKAKAA